MSDKVISFKSIENKLLNIVVLHLSVMHAFTYGWSNLISYYGLDILALRS